MNAVAAPLRIAFTVYGQAAPAGSKRHVGGHRIIDASKRSAPWKNLVAEYAARAMDDLTGRGQIMGEVRMKSLLVGGITPTDLQRLEEHPRVPLLDGALAVKMTFYVPRPKGHYSKRALLPEQGCESNRAAPGSAHPALLLSAPIWPTTRPDVLKLARAVEDACTGVIWRDDAQIVVETLVKKYGEPARVEVVVTEA